MSDETSWTPGELPTPQRPRGGQPDAGSQPPDAPQPPAPGWSAPDSHAAPASPYQPPPPANPYAQAPVPPPDPYGSAPYPAAPSDPYPQAPYGQGPYAPVPPGFPGGPPPAYLAAGRRDGVSIAALVTGIFLLGIVPLVLGIVGLGRARRLGLKGRGMAIAGVVLGVVSLVGGALLGYAVLSNDEFRDSFRQGALHAQCENGDMAACDRLYDAAEDGSAQQEFADTCGGRTGGGFLCTAIGDDTYGDDENLDRLWDACDSGDGTACEELYYSAEPGSGYEEFGATCGGRTDGSTPCPQALEESSDDPSQQAA